MHLVCHSSRMRVTHSSPKSFQLRENLQGLTLQKERVILQVVPPADIQTIEPLMVNMIKFSFHCT